MRYEHVWYKFVFDINVYKLSNQQIHPKRNFHVVLLLMVVVDDEAKLRWRAIIVFHMESTSIRRNKFIVIFYVTLNTETFFYESANVTWNEMTQCCIKWWQVNATYLEWSIKLWSLNRKVTFYYVNNIICNCFVKADWP